MTTAREQVIQSLADKEYRDAFVAEHITQGVAFQIRATRKGQGLSQAALGRLCDASQPLISDWENPDNEGFTLKTLERLASALDVALIVRFAPFSELVDWSIGITNHDVPDHEHDPGFRDRETTAVGAHRTIGVSAVTMLGTGLGSKTARNIVYMEEYTRGRTTLSQAGGTAPPLAVRISG